MKLKAMFVALILLLFANTTGLKAQRREIGGTEKAKSGSQVIRITMTDAGFQPNVLRLDAEPGQKVMLQIENRSKNEHGLRIKIGSREYGPQDVVAPGKTVEYEMTMPNEGGVGSFYSPTGDDRTKGFNGRAIVGGEAPAGMS